LLFATINIISAKRDERKIFSLRLADNYVKEFVFVCMNLSNFVERLSELMGYENLTSTELGKRLGCGNATISHYLSGRYLPTVEMTVKLADYFKCSTDYLLGLTEENYESDFKPCPPFGTRLLEVCNYYEITRAELRRRTGISESVMRYWVRGKTNPTIVNVVRIAEKLNCSVDFVLGRET